jgi:hemerythrin-like domain-containing protein
MLFPALREVTVPPPEADAAGYIPHRNERYSRSPGAYWKLNLIALIAWENRMSVKSAVRNATKKVVKTFSAEADSGAGTDLLDTLKQEHDEVKALLSDLQDADTSAQRKGLVQKIKLALVPHTKAEEKILYDAVIAVRDKEVQVDGHEGYIEHDLAAKTLQKLAGIANGTSPEHKAAAKVLKELVEHHIKEEESNVWDDAKDNFSDEQRKQMNVAYLAAKARVRVP